jgi:CheY-like chemotaxis protein
MTQALVVISNPDEATKVADILHRLQVRTKIVSIPEAASGWLKMEHFDFLIVGGEVEAKSATALFIDAWKNFPFLTGMVLIGAGGCDWRWEVTLLGAIIFEGKERISQFEKFISQLSPHMILEGGKEDILVIDDLDAPRDILCSYIERMGFTTVRGFSQVKDAVEELHRNPKSYMAALSDVQMPDGGALTFLSNIRKSTELFFLPVIVVTANPTSATLLACLRLGASGFVAKPPKKSILQFELEKARRMHRLLLDPRLCAPEDADRLELALRKTGRLV